MTIETLYAAGHTKMRLAHWNEFAYIEVEPLPSGQLGPWITLYDVGAGVGGGEPVRMLLAFADQAQVWGPWPCPTAVGSTDDQKDDHEYNDRKDLVIPAGGLTPLRRPRGEPARSDEWKAGLAYGLACDQRDAWEGLALGLDRLLAHYRSGSTPSGALLDRIREARERIAALAREAQEL